MTPEILDVHFSRRKSKLECEILSLQSLFRRNLQHSIEQPHRLRFYLVMLITQGAGRHVVDFRPYPYQTQTLLFIAGNQVQQFQINPFSEGFLIVFTKEFLYQSLQDRRILQSFHIFDYSLQASTLLLNAEDYQFFLTLFQQIQREYIESADDFVKEEILRNLVRLALLRAERLKQSETRPAVLSHYLEFSRFKAQLEKDFVHTRNVKDTGHSGNKTIAGPHRLAAQRNCPANGL